MSHNTEADLRNQIRNILGGMFVAPSGTSDAATDERWFEYYEQRFMQIIEANRQQAVAEARADQIQIDFLKYSLCTDVDEFELITIAKQLTAELSDN